MAVLWEPGVVTAARGPNTQWDPGRILYLPAQTQWNNNPEENKTFHDQFEDQTENSG